MIIKQNSQQTTLFTYNMKTHYTSLLGCGFHVNSIASMGGDGWSRSAENVTRSTLSANLSGVVRREWWGLIPCVFDEYGSGVTSEEIL